jgi:hypothetical protein
MVTRQQVERLELRIEGLAKQRARQHPRERCEFWMLDQGVARCMKTGEEIAEAELEARPYDGRRIVYTIVDPPSERITGRRLVPTCDTRAGAA